MVACSRAESMVSNVAMKSKETRSLDDPQSIEWQSLSEARRSEVSMK